MEQQKPEHIGPIVERVLKNLKPIRRETHMDKLPEIIPVHDRILVRRLPEEEKTISGVYIPDSGKDRPQLGKVLAVGPGRIDDNGKLIPCGCEKGDIILFGRYSYTDVELGGQSFLMLRSDELWGIVKNYEVREVA